MKKIFNTYNNPAEYLADTKEPNSVSLVKGDNTASDKVFFDGDYRLTQDKNKARVGDIVLVNDGDRSLLYISPSLYLKRKNGGFFGDSAVGVVVITPDEDNDNGEIHIVACRYMDYSNLNYSSATDVPMAWGDYRTAVPNLDIINTVSCVVPGTTTISSNGLGYAKFEFPYGNVTQGDADVYSMWNMEGDHPYIPSPYDHSLQMIAGTANDNEGASLNGKTNTEKILAAVNHTGDITNSSDAGHYPAAECCWSFRLYASVDDNPVQLLCYLPTAKELLYLAARFETINTSLIMCGMSSLTAKWLWSSTQYSKNLAFVLRADSGLLVYQNKFLGDSCVLGFISISPVTIEGGGGGISK